MQLPHLATVTAPIPLTNLTTDQVTELQTALAVDSYPVGTIDGVVGPRTKSVWAEFKTDVYEGNPDLIGPGSVQTLQAKLKNLPNDGSGYDFTTKAGTIDAIKRECVNQNLTMSAQIAYVLATTQWETAQTFQPVREAFWQTETWRQANLGYYPYYGRGYVQLTWESNYAKYARLLGVDLVNQRDLALTPVNALFILIQGFKTGAFTGRKITDYINSQGIDYVSARRCINGTDHATDIANLAQTFVSSI
jgi:peptidoglycan hydrolase-like protein with peptidoglycan-binding domain